MYALQTFVRDSKLSFSKQKTDIYSSWRLARGNPVRLQNFKKYSGAKNSIVWKYFGFIKAKDATKTNLDVTNDV